MSGASNQLVVSLGLNSTDFQKKIKVINQKMKEFESEFKAAESAMSKFGNQQEKLGAKLTTLRNKFELSEKKVKEYRNELENVEKTVTKHKTAYDKLERTLQSQRKELQELEQTLGKGSEKYKELKQEIKDNEDALRRKANAIAEAEARVSRHNTALNKAQQEYNELQREIRETESALKNLKLQETANNLVKIGNVSKTVGSSLKSIGSNLTTSVTLPIVAFGAAASKTFSEYEAQVRRVNALSSSETMNMAERYDYLSEKTREFGRSTEWTALEVGQAYEYFAMAGKTVEEATAAMEPMLNLASIGMLDLGEAADIVTDTMTPFASELQKMGEKAKVSGKDFNEAEWMIDRFAATITNSNTNISLMGETLKYAAPTVASLGGKFEDLSLAIGTMANAGIKGSMAGTSLSTGLNRLVKPTKNSAEAMEKYGIELQKTEGGQVDLLATMEHLRDKLGKLSETERGRVVTTIFGQTAQKGWLAILNAEQKEWDKLKEAIQGADGATEEMMNEIKKSGAYGFKVMQSAISDLLIVVGDALAPALVSVAENITDLVTKISNWVTKMHETNPQLLETIGKLALFAAAAGPVLSILGSMSIGFGSLTQGLGGVIKGFLNFKGKLAETAATAAAGTSKFSILASTIGVSGPVLIGAGVAALVTLMTTIGNNENALSWLIDKWGAFGTAVSGVCEFVAGVVQLTFGNLLILIGGIGKAIVAFVTGKWREIDDIMRETGASMQTNTKEAWSNIKMESTRAIGDIRDMTERDMEGVKGAFEGALKTLPGLTRDNLNQTGEEFANLFKSANGNMLDLSDSTIKILRGTSDTMATLFSGIKGNMDLEEAKTQFISNMEALLRSGEISLDQLEREFKGAGDLIAKNMANSFERVKNETGQILTELGDIARDGLEPVANDITSIIDGMSGQTIETIRNMGTNWSTLFKGIGSDGSMSVLEMKNQILSNMEELGLNTPEKLEAFKSALVTELDNAKAAAKEKTNGTAEEISENMVPNGDSVANSTKTELDKNTTAVEQAAAEATEASAQGGKNVGKAFQEGVNNTENVNLNLSDKVNQAAEEAKTVGNQKGGEVITSMTNSMTTQLPQMDNVTKKISDRLSKIDNIRLGGVTKQLSEVNRWIGVCNSSAAKLRSALVNLTNLPFGNTTRGLSETNKWLGNVKISATSARAALINLTNLPFGNTTKGLSETNKWLDNVTKSAKTTANALKEIVKITYGSVTKGLSEINRWLNTIKSSAATARANLVSLGSVGFGGLISSLNSLNRALNSVKSTASSVKTAVNSVSAARPRSVEMPATISEYSEAPTFKMPRVDLTPYKMDYNKSTMSAFSPSVKVETQTIQDNSNKEILEAILGLVQVIGSQQINVGVNMNGKTLATATAPFIKTELNKIEKRTNRLAGK